MPHDQLQMLADRAELHTLLDRYLLSPDEDRFEDAWLRTIFTDDIAVDYTFVSHQGLEGMAEFARGFFSRFERVHHVGANCLVDLNGDLADVRANVIATHVPRAAEPEAHFTVGGYYDAEAVRSAGGWRYRHLKLNIVWTVGRTPAG